MMPIIRLSQSSKLWTLEPNGLLTLCQPVQITTVSLMPLATRNLISTRWDKILIRGMAMSSDHSSTFEYYPSSLFSPPAWTHVLCKSQYPQLKGSNALVILSSHRASIMNTIGVWLITLTEWAPIQLQVIQDGSL